MVDAKQSNGRFWFVTSGRIKFEWLGSLKPAVAQRAVQGLASNLSKVGVDESEWLRRKSEGRTRMWF